MTNGMQETLKNNLWLLTASSILHFLVDGLCVCCLYLMVSSESMALMTGVFLTYDILAFMTQPLTGMCADSSRLRPWLLPIAAALLTLAVLLAAWWHDAGGMTLSSGAMLTVATLLGMGNSCFHVWGGKLTAVRTGNDMRALGVFVSTGAMGLSVGLVFCSWPLLLAFLLLMGIMTMICWLYASKNETNSEQQTAKCEPRITKTLIWIAMVALIGFVMFRSYVGEIFTHGVSKTQTLVLIIGATSMIGKMAGGWLAKRVGIVGALVIALVTVAVCFIGKNYNVAIFLAGLFAINLTMPVTLYLANVALKGREGLAFGWLAAALIPGYLIAIW